jgi:hypothetical protein
MSWESHLMGMMVGLGLALLYRDEGPVIPKHVWEEEEEEEESQNEGQGTRDEGQVGE